MLTPSETRSHCPSKGVADRYWSVRDRADLRDIAWSYARPYPAVGAIAGRVAFYNELLDITVDGVRLDRPTRLSAVGSSDPVPTEPPAEVLGGGVHPGRIGASECADRTAGLVALAVNLAPRPADPPLRDPCPGIVAGVVGYRGC